MILFQADRFIGKGRSVGIFSGRGTLPQQLHCHDFIEIVYITSGHSIQQVDDVEYTVSRGDMIFINYAANHAFRSADGFSYINICFLPEVLSGAITRENALALLSMTAFDELREEKNGGTISFSDQEREEVEQILQAMLRENQRSDLFAAQVMENYLHILLTKMLRRSSEGLSPSSDLWQKLERHIADNLKDPLTLPSLAQKCFYNPSYFSRAFKQKMGCSLTAYIRSKRVEQAQQLLRSTDLSVDDIAVQVGYSDRSAFCHVFSKITGMTPSRYRTESKNHPHAT